MMKHCFGPPSSFLLSQAAPNGAAAACRTSSRKAGKRSCARSWLLASSTLALCFLPLAGAALAGGSGGDQTVGDGGNGSDGSATNATGAPGGGSTAGTTNPGANGSTLSGGGGGTAGINGGAGGSGAGGASGAVGQVVGGSSTINASVSGGAGGGGGVGGGGGGGAGLVSTGGGTTTVSAAIGGGNGGSSGVHGGGGGGGDGLGLTAGGTLAVNAVVTGGRGGNGSIGGGGGGGAGIVAAGGTSSMTINAAVTGGNGGFGDFADGGGGAGIAAPGGGNTTAIINAAVTGGNAVHGSGGAGVIGTNLDITISGTGAIAGGAAGGGLGTVGNAITFKGGTNALELQSGYSITGKVLGTGTDTLRLGGAANATFDISQVTPLLASALQFQGFNSLSKVGTSIWTLTGTGTYAGATSVNAGTLLVNGSTATSSLTTVNAAGMLGGTGAVGNTAVNGGTLAPGNGPGSIGTLAVQGSLSFTAAATYLVQISPTNASRTNVTGGATLGGATVNASFAPGSYVAKQYTVLNAGGGLTGTFGALVNTNLPASFASSLSYDANNVFLDLTLAPFASATGLNINQRNVATSLSNFFNTNGGIPLVFASLAPGGLTIASGELPTAAQQTTFDAMNLFMGVMTDPFVAGRGNGISSSSAASGFDDERFSAYATPGRNERDAYASIYRKAPVMADPFVQRWSIWAAGYGGSQTTVGNVIIRSNAATSRIYGTTVGADYRFSPDTLAGFALAGGGTNFSLANALGTGRSDLFQAGAYVRHTSGPAYVSAALAYGWQGITTDRTVTIAGADRLRAEFNANAWSGRLEGGYRFVALGLGLTPYAAGQFTTFDLPGYAETVLSGANTFALAYAAKSVTASRSELGLRTDKSFAVQDGIFTLRGRAAWAHDFNTDRSVLATFQTLPGASFTVNGASQAPDAALVTGTAEMKWLNGFSVAATFEGEFSGVTTSYAGKGVVRYAW